MQKFIVLFCMPMKGLEEWGAKPEAERKAAEEDMKAKWDAWMAANAAMMVGGTAGVGKTMRVTAAGAGDAKNDIMLYSVVQGESQEAVAKAFEGHPHLAIPGSWIDISTTRDISEAKS